MRKTFDDIMRRRWEEQQFPVDANHRQHMMELLNGNKKRRAFAFWWWGAGAVVLVAGLFLLQTSNDTTQAADEMPASIESSKTTALKNVNGNNVANGNTTSSSTFTQTQTATTPINNPEENNALKAGDLKENAAGPSAGANIESSNTKKNKNSTSPSKRADHIRTNPGITLQSPTTRSSQREVMQTDNEIVTSANIKSPEEGNNQPSVTPTTPTNSSVASTTVNTTSAVDKEPLSQPARQMLDVAWLDALPIQALAMNNDKSIGSIEPANKHKHPFYAFAEAGVGVILGSQPAYPAGWKVNAGAGIGYLLQPKLNLMLSGGYLLQHAGFDFERTSTLHSSGFGARSQINSLKPDRLHYVYAKLGLQYRMKRHSIGGSMGAQWLYGAQGTITEVINDQITGVSENPRYAWLNLNGLNRLHYNAGVQYGYRLTPHINVAAGTQFYFTSLTAHDPALVADGYNWKGKTAKVQPFITFNYLLYGPF